MQVTSSWFAALVLEVIALLAIIGVAQPLFFQRMLQRLSAQQVPVAEGLEVDSENIYFVHPMDAFRPPSLAPAQSPTKTTQSSTFWGRPSFAGPSNF